MIRTILTFFQSRSTPLSAALPNEKHRGFTLIELLVVVAIIVFIGGALLFQGSGSRGDMEVTNLSYDIALLLREAQVYGVGVRERTIGSSNFSDSYGVAFLKSVPSRAHLFADANGNRAFDSGEIIKEVILPGGVRISKFCGTDSVGGGTVCSDTTTGFDWLTVTFTRPDPDAVIKGMGGRNFSDADITVTGLGNKTRVINILPTGQISVER